MRLARAEWIIAVPWRLGALVFVLLGLPILVLGQLSANETRARAQAAQMEAAGRAADRIQSDMATQVAAIEGTIRRLALSGRLAASGRDVSSGPAPQDIDQTADRSLMGSAILAGEHAQVQTLTNLVWGGSTRVVVRTYVVAARSGSLEAGQVIAAAPVHPQLGIDPEIHGRRFGDLSDRGSVAARGIAALPAANTPGVTAVVAPSASGQAPLLVYVLTPSVFRQGLDVEKFAAVVIEIDLAKALVDAAGPTLASSDEAYLVDPAGRLMARINGAVDFPLRDLTKDPAISGLLLEGAAQDGALDPVTGSRRLLASVAFSLGDGHRLVVAQDTSAADADLDAVLRQLAIAQVSLVIVLLVGAVLFGRATSATIRSRREVAAALERESALAAELRHANVALAEATEAKSRFLANMSHELRTPLNAIIGFSDVLRSEMVGAVNEKQREYLDDVLSSGRHLLSLINDILDLSKVEAGRMDLELSEVSLQAVIDEAVTLIRERASRHGIELATESDGVDRIQADERKLRQILLNLLSNAVKFTPDGGWVGVRVTRQDGEIELSVRDTGVGIAPEDLPKVFEEFRQVGTASARAEGTGLGLTLTRRLVELHGGRIWVESESGEGTTFTFRIPAREPAAAAADVGQG